MKLIALLLSCLSFSLNLHAEDLSYRDVIEVPSFSYNRSSDIEKGLWKRGPTNNPGTIVAILNELQNGPKYAELTLLLKPNCLKSQIEEALKPALQAGYYVSMIEVRPVKNETSTMEDIVVSIETAHVNPKAGALTVKDITCPTAAYR